MKNVFSSWRFAAPVLVATYLLFGLAFSAAPSLLTTTTTFGAIQHGKVTAHHAQPQAVKMIAISDAQAKQLALTTIGSGLSSRMLHRVTTSTAPQHSMSYVTTTTSSNWGGYYVNASNIEGSYGCLTDTSAPTYDAASWTGVGGVYGTGDLAQTGVDQYYQEAWIETYPNPADFLFSTHAGDTICSEVKYVSSGTWYLNVTDKTTGTYYANNYSFTPDRSSAEWITEAQPGYHVPNFGTVPFSSTYWFNSSGSEVSATSGGTLYKVNLISPYGGAVCPGTESGTSFTNRYSSSGSC